MIPFSISTMSYFTRCAGHHGILPLYKYSSCAQILICKQSSRVTAIARGPVILPMMSKIRS